jgi:predicted site-specific integrase-resolvase
MSTELPTYITLEDAARRYRIAPEVLTERVNSGKIRAVRLNGTIALAEEDVVSLAEDLALRAQVAHLQGRPITLTRAARTYGLNSRSLWQWTQAGRVRVLGRVEGKGRARKLFLDESDVAYIRLLMDKIKPKPGTALFRD